MKKLIPAPIAGAYVATNQRKTNHMRKLNFLCAATFVLGLTVTIPLAEAQTLTPLHDFTGAPDGAFSEAALVRDAAGNLFGTTTSGGSGDGTVFKVDSTGRATILFNFSDFVSGGFPSAALIQDKSETCMALRIPVAPVAPESCSNFLSRVRKPYCLPFRED